jgi:cell division protein ZapA (FtsZ GTPase activity inhibitor)
MKGVNVEIMGQSLTVASDDGDEWARNLAATVDAKIKHIRASGQSVNSINLSGCAGIIRR